MMSGDRLRDLQRLYSLLSLLQAQANGTRLLEHCTGKMDWPARGVYFFMEEGEIRTDTGSGPRIVRVGTHALHAGSGTALWHRLSQHRGRIASGGGNHRGSIFRLIVGTALITKHHLNFPSWDKDDRADKDTRANELPLERQVSQVIRAMPFLWLSIDDPPGPASLRGEIERNTISLLSNYNKPPLDLPSEAWLGCRCSTVTARYISRR
jgi:hypothetical protein